MTRELTDEQIKELALEAFDCTWDADDETLVNRYGHGVYLWRFADFARAVIEADRALRVPMTDSEIDASWVGTDGEGFIEGIRAAEAFHGIGEKA